MATPSVSECIRAGKTALENAGIENAGFEARHLFLHAAGWAREQLISEESSPVQDSHEAGFLCLVERRLGHEPLSHILGHVDFMGHQFKTDQRALAPRMDSERLVEAVLRLTDDVPSGKIADLGVGSGCLLLSVLAERPEWTGTGLDLSEDALSLTRENAEALRLEPRVSLLHGEWDAARDVISQADIVMSNPPYIASSVVDELDPEVRYFDPRMALDGGMDGLDAYREIVALCATAMRPGAWLVFEIGYDQGEAVSSLLSASKFSFVRVHKDFSGQDRVIVAHKV